MAIAADWQPVAGHIMTRWAKEVSPDNAWAEYPRPQMVRGEWQCLNGLWDYAINGEEAAWKLPNVRNAAYDPLLKELPKPPDRWDGKILVPFAVESALSGVGRLVRPHQLLWYRRAFDVPPTWQGRRILLHFEAVDWHCAAWINGQKAGENKGGYVPFNFDITPALKPAGPQEIVLAVWDPSNAGDQAVGKQALPENRLGWRYTPSTGIWQPVWLEPVPETSIARLRLAPDVDRGRLVAQAKLSAAAADAEIEVRAFDGETLVAKARGAAAGPLALEIPRPKLWSPQTPFLYDLKVALRRDGKTIDEVGSYFGMRKIEVSKDADGTARIKLNGRGIFSFGPLDQGYWPDGILTPPSDAAAKYDVQYLRDIGCNLVRVHVTVHPSRWYYWCDKLGLMVWQDFVSMPKYGSALTPACTAQWEGEQARMIDNLRNHPAIVAWVVFNEGWGQYDTRRLTQWVQQRDPTRLVNDASGSDAGEGNLCDVHNYAFLPSIARPGQLGERAMVLGECGGFEVLAPGHTWDHYPAKEDRIDPLGGGVREKYADAATWEGRYAFWIENLRLLRHLGLSAAVYTQISDVEHECNGWMTYDRRISKIPVERLRALHERLYAPLDLKPIVPMRAAGLGEPTPPDRDLHVERTFTIRTVPARVAVCVAGAGSARVYVNGQLVKRLANRMGKNYVPASIALLDSESMKALHPGSNLLTVELKAPGSEPRTGKARFVDVGLFDPD